MPIKKKSKISAAGKKAGFKNFPYILVQVGGGPTPPLGFGGGVRPPPLPLWRMGVGGLRLQRDH